MIKKTTRNTKFQGKEEDYSISVDFRNLTTEKSVLDCISEYSEYQENTTFVIYDNDKEMTSFHVEDFRNGKEISLTLYQAQKKVLRYEIEEEILKTLKTENKESENLIISRLVKLVY